MSFIAVLVAVVALLVTVISCVIALPMLRRAGIVDVPSGRSSHTAITVRGGGLAIGVGITAATVTQIVLTMFDGGVLGLGEILMPLSFLVLTWCYSSIGMADDLDSLKPVGRLFGQIVIALVFSACIALFSTHGIAHVLVFAVVGVGLVNAVNFVDGLNGFVSMWAIATGAWYAVVGAYAGLDDIMLVSLALAGAVAGFLPFNLGRARAFLGDTGSYGIGAAVFTIAVWLFIADVPVVVIVAPLIFVIFDVGVTLVWRLFAGENIFRPHRTHIYQRIQQSGWSHEQVGLLHVCFTVLACLLAVPTLLEGNTSMTYPGHIFWVALLAVYIVIPVWARRRSRSKAVPA